jgi:hypothetical protein
VDEKKELTTVESKPALHVDLPALPIYQANDEPVPGNAIEIAPDDQLQLQEKARLEFGKKLASLIGLQHLEIKVANMLPPSNTSNNAFGNSYMYVLKDNTLLVHSNRLSSYGDFGLVVVHALSHIKVC